ncbi:hypothetical protein LINGRAHAP2_LOCUS15073 [Linum grandiflorum]
MFDATKRNDLYSLHAIRMSMRVFQKLCKELVDISGLKRTNNVEVDEMVVMFLHTLGHNIKNRILQQHFGRSGKTICAVIHAVLISILNMHEIWYKKAEPVTEQSGHAFWKHFKNLFMLLLWLFSVFCYSMPRKKKDEKKKDENNEEKERPYFSWNDELDQILVNSMMMLVESRKIDPKGKFVAGAYLLLEDMIERAKPGCGVKADPNIMSRVKTLKQKFLAVQELRGLSGAGWDETLKMVILDDHVFAEYVQNHKHCAKLNKVSFPCYDGLEFVYGKARATGAGAVGLDELREKMPCPAIEVPNNLLLGWEPTQFEQPTEPTGMQNEEAEYVAVDDEVPPPTPTDKAQQSDATSRPKKVRRTTKSAPATDEGDALQLILKAAVDNLQSMTGQSDQTNNLKDNLFEQVEKVEGISADEAVDAAFKIVKDADLLRLFYSMTSVEARKRLIQQVLREP